MEEKEHPKQLKKNTIMSLLSLFFQSGYSAALGLISNLILTIVLAPEIFGVYILTLSIISFLNYFSDIGLAASLVQKKEVSDEDIITTFTIQQLLIITLISIGYLLTPWIRDWYNLPGHAVYLYWALLGAFFLSSLKTIPSIFLERQVQFQKIVLVQVVENTIFYITVSILALMNFGLQSFTVAVLVRAITGTSLMYYISFWFPRVGISRASLQNLLSFGVPFQANTVLALFKDEFILLFIGKFLGLEALGYIGWAKRWAEAPIRIIMDNVNRILFPIFSRLQHDKKRLSELVEKILYHQTLIFAPLYTGMILLMDHLVNIIPKYNKWEPGLPLFYVICVSAFFASFSTPFINLFNALGKVKLSFYLMILWTGGTWLFAPLLSQYYGRLGYPLTLLILSSSFGIVVFLAKKYIDFSFFKSILPAILSSAIMGVVVNMLDSDTVTFPYLLVIIGLGAMTYFGLLYGVFRRNIIKDFRDLLKYD